MILIICKLRLFFNIKRLDKMDRKILKFKDKKSYMYRSLLYEFNVYVSLSNCLDERIEHIKKENERIDYYGYFK